MNMSNGTRRALFRYLRTSYFTSVGVSIVIFQVWRHVVWNMRTSTRKTLHIRARGPPRARGSRQNGDQRSKTNFRAPLKCVLQLTNVMESSAKQAFNFQYFSTLATAGRATEIRFKRIIQRYFSPPGRS